MKTKEKYFEKNHGEVLGLMLQLLKSLILNQSLFFPFVFIKLNEKLHCPKFFNMETFKTILWIMSASIPSMRKKYTSFLEISLAHKQYI